jgi:surfeit locus 1 family protein
MSRRRLTPYLTPKMLGLHLLAVALTAAMAALGLWQMGSYGEEQQRDAAAAADARPVPLDSLLRPDQAFTAEAAARPVVAEGEYGEPQLLVARGSGAPWVVAPLVTESGAAILVVRGLAHGAQAPPAQTGHVRVDGSLQPSEPRATDDDPSDATVPSLNTAQLVGQFGTDLYSGYVVLTEQHPPETLPRATAPTPEPSLTAGLRNLMYGLQWWVFGGFVVFLWWRTVREQAQVA